MTRRRWAAVLCVLVLATGCGRGSHADDAPVAEPPASNATGAPAAAAGRYQPFTVLGAINDPSIDESSGLAASRRNPGLLWTHNDSGNPPYLFATNPGNLRVSLADVPDEDDDSLVIVR